MTKLVNLSKKNTLLGAFIRAFCRIALFCVSAWNEVTGLLRTIGIHGNTYESLKSYKNKYDGKRCFIIATGPSLTISDMEALKDEYTFGMNSIIKVYDKTSFRPSFYGIQDHIVYKSLENEIQKYYKGHDNAFISDRIMWHFKVDKKWNIFPLNMSYHAYRRWFKDDFFVKFSDNIYRRTYSGFSITYTMIAIAVYMGFKEIYLIGADCSFHPGQKMHFAEHGVVDTQIDSAQQRNIAGYVKAKEYADAHGIKINNATRGGELEVYPRVNLDDILNR